MTKSEYLPGADDTGVQAVAQVLVLARSSLAGAHPATLADAAGWEDPSAGQAYRVQARVARHFGWFADGPPLHWKSGGPTRDALLTHAPLPPAGVGPGGRLAVRPARHRGGDSLPAGKGRGYRDRPVVDPRGPTG